MHGPEKQREQTPLRKVCASQCRCENPDKHESFRHDFPSHRSNFTTRMMNKRPPIRLVYGGLMLSPITRLTFLTLQLAFLAPHAASAYSVLTHEAIIDSSWETTFKPILLKRFPTATADELRRAHAFAYGGGGIQGMGFFSFRTKIF